ncbi:MAG TPA: cobyrinate a,c-diamide synthase [Candidatus Saccharimonadales bacterium]|nr:cobyrinate a,c-diamide synthase [Candidatus Saccharimonadales bacterium]
MLEEVGIPRLVVGGLGSGSGKTSISLGLTAALRARGRTVQTFKVGADFIDTAYLAHASRRPCRNLDSWLLGHEGVRRSLAHGAIGADRVIVEGAMGVLDGHGMAAETPATNPPEFPGSTLEVARIISAPVVLVVDAWAMGETAAAAALGIKELDGAGSVIGVILNNVPNDYRRRVIEDAIWSLARMPVLGALPHLQSVRIPELRSGLLPLLQNPHVDEAITELGEAVTRHCDLDLVERLMEAAGPLQPAPRRHAFTPRSEEPVRIGVAFDDAFCFYYSENLELLEDAGAEIITFSPLEDPALPQDLGLIYIGGGISEAFVPTLARNQSFLESLRRAHAHGTPVYAEGCGLQYSARSLRTSDGTTHRMAGLIPIDIALEAGTLHSGYRDLSIATASMLGPVGTRLRGHEFHFSRLLSGADCLNPAYTMHDCDGEPLGCEGWTDPLILASFIHLHFGQDQQLASRLVESARECLDHRTHTSLAGRSSRFAAPV